MSKWCKYCETTKPITDFYVKSSSKDGRQVKCKNCERETRGLFDPVLEKIRKEVRDLAKEGKRRCTLCKEIKAFNEYWTGKCVGDVSAQCKACNLAGAKERRRVHGKDYLRKSRMVLHYNITLDQYYSLLESQNGVCYLCQKPPKDSRALAVDHDHACCPESARSCGNCIRGLLCGVCNRYIVGAVDKYPGYLDRLVEYLGTRPTL